MEFIRRLSSLNGLEKPSVATIGNFDGVHLGHQAVLKQLRQNLTAPGQASTVIIFEPQPIEFFSPDKVPSRLTRLREKLWQLDKQDIDRVVCLKFDQHIANLSAHAFVEKILVGGLKLEKLIIGDDFRFAKNREGDYAYLLAAGKQFGFEVIKTNSYNSGEERISSTLIRQALADGNIVRANTLLGRPYRITGRVVHGDQRGRRLGFATANIELHRYVSPVTGIFSGRVYGIDMDALDAVIYVGSKPVYQGTRVTLEVHILDFDRELYGKHLQVEFLEKLRGDQNFSSEQQLIAQIAKDIESAKQSLKLNS